MIPYEILAPDRVGTSENADWPLRSDRRFRFSCQAVSTTQVEAVKIIKDLGPGSAGVPRTEVSNYFHSFGSGSVRSLI